MNKIILCCSALVATSLLAGCATEASRTLEVPKVTAYATQYQGQRSPIAVGKFDNRSSYLRGLFSDGVDRRITSYNVCYTKLLRWPRWDMTTSSWAGRPATSWCGCCRARRRAPLT